MASSKEYLTFILEQLSGLDGVSYRAMMGEYILYYKEKIIGGIYDDRLLVKPVETAQKYIPEAALVSPYPGAKEMLLVDNVDSKDYLTTLFKAMFDELPAPKAKRKTTPAISSYSRKPRLKRQILMARMCCLN